jgi:PST family polysaccharide transporter
MNYINKIRKTLYENEGKTILNNFFSLSVIQGTNFILPLIVLPYLIKVIGLDKFGLVSFAQAFMSYFIMFTDYGFNLIATREIAVNKNDKTRLSLIVNNTLLTKIILCFFSFFLLLLIISFFPYFSEYASLYYLSFFLVVGQVLIPTWFFQGIEQMKYLTYLNLVAKIIFTVLIFILITKPADFIYVPVFYSLGNIVSGIFALGIMKKKFNIRFTYPANFRFIEELKKGWYVFLSNFSINAYINSNLFILGLFASNIVLGYYSIADKILYAFRQILNVFFNATYPQACQKVIISHFELRRFFKKYFYPFLLIILVLCLVLFVMAEPLTVFLAGRAVPGISFAIRLLSFVPVIICLNIPAFQTLLAYNFQKSYMIVLATFSVLNIILNLVLAPIFSMTGTAMSIILTEIFITAGLYLVLITRHKQQSIINPRIL